MTLYLRTFIEQLEGYSCDQRTWRDPDPELDGTPRDLADWVGQRAILRSWEVEWTGRREDNVPGLRRRGQQCECLRAHWAMRDCGESILLLVRFRDGEQLWCWATDLGFVDPTTTTTRAG